MPTYRFKIAIIAVMICALIQSCDRKEKSGDYYYDMAMESLSRDSIEVAFCQMDKAMALYARDKEKEKEGEARIVLSMLYFSNNLKEKAYELIEDLEISPIDTCNYLLKSNYLRIKSYYKSLVENNNEEAIEYIDIVINNDKFLEESLKKPHLQVDMLNKTEFLLNAGRIDEAEALMRQIETMVGNDTACFPQLYINKARIMDMKGEADSAYMYAQLVERTTSKAYKDGDNLLTALQLMMSYDSVAGNFTSYVDHRSEYEAVVKDLNGDKNRLRMELLSNENKMELAELNHAHQRQLYTMLAILIFSILHLITLLVLSKYLAARKQRQLIQLECEKLDAECFKRKLECELYSRKMQAKDVEMQKINQDLLDLSYKLTNIHKLHPAEGQEVAKDHLARLRQKLQSDHPEFSKRMLEKFPDITKTELILAELIRLNLNTEEITSLLNITQAGLIKSRYRLRKRLGVKSSSELDSFIARV